MQLFISRKEKVRRFLTRSLPPVLCLALVLLLFAGAISSASSRSVSSQRQTLIRALQNGAVRVYAMTGAYPASLAELLAATHITYDPEVFLVEYTAQASNLFPSIFVLPLKGNDRQTP